VNDDSEVEDGEWVYLKLVSTTDSPLYEMVGTYKGSAYIGSTYKGSTHRQYIKAVHIGSTYRQYI
jgi:hypothetical protein